MTPVRARTLPLLALVVGALGWLALDVWTGEGRGSPPLPWTVVLGTAVLALAVLAAGWEVRRTVRGRRPRPLDPLAAARAAVLAKAGAYGGAVLAGWYAAQGLVLLPDPVGEQRSRLVVAGVATLAAVGLAVAGLVAQRWCRVPPRDDGAGADPAQDEGDHPAGRHPEGHPDDR